MQSIYISVINDLVSDARAHRTCITLLKSGEVVTLIGRRLKSSPELAARDYVTKRFSLPVNKGFLFYLIYNIRLLIYLLSRKKTGILVACDLDTLPANYIASCLRNYKLVYDSHEYFTEIPELQNRPFVKKIWLKVEKFILPRLGHAYTVSHSIANEYEAKYGLKFNVIRNLPLKKASTGIFPLPENINKKKKIIYQGAVNIGRGIEAMMETVILMENVVFIIAGEGDLYNSLRKISEEEKFRDKVYFSGRIPIEKLHDLTIQADMGISLEKDLGKNYRYALPNKLFDYFHAGIPVLVSDLPEMRAVIEKYKTGIVAENTTPDYLKEKVEFMLYNQEARMKWEKNLSKAAEELCWEKEELKLMEIYTKVGLVFKGW